MHTPGPWIIESKPVPYSNKRHWRILDEHLQPITQSDVGPHAFNEDNARLIAAAPDMYALLNELMDTELSADTLRVLQPWLRRVELAIGKASPEAKGE